MGTEESGAPRLLCVDDEEMVLGVYPRALSPAYELTRCRQGDEAVEQARRAVAEARPFAVAFLDVRMPPGLDGVQAAKQIRSLEIEEHRGLLYDAAAVEACLSVFRSKGYRFPGLMGEVRLDR